MFINVLPCRATVFGDQFKTSETGELLNQFKFYNNIVYIQSNIIIYK